MEIQRLNEREEKRRKLRAMANNQNNSVLANQGAETNWLKSKLSNCQIF